jgi:hypothetical protein
MIRTAFPNQPDNCRSESILGICGRACSEGAAFANPKNSWLGRPTLLFFQRIQLVLPHGFSLIFDLHLGPETRTPAQTGSQARAAVADFPLPQTSCRWSRWTGSGAMAGFNHPRSKSTDPAALPESAGRQFAANDLGLVARLF